MTKAHSIPAGILVSLCLFTGLLFLPEGMLVLMALGFCLVLVALARGPRLPLMFRVFITCCIFYWAFATSLVGRTMEPGLTAYTVGMAFIYFAFLGCWPGIALARLWRPKMAILLICALFPVGLALAETVAGAEEYLFVRKYHDTGVGTTSRWTVSMHWLAYDKETHRLSGSD